MSIDAGDRWVEYEIKERERVGRYMYDHQEDYVSRSRYEKIVDQLTKAKELLRMVIDSYNHKERFSFEKDLMKAEQFLNSEVENEM